MIAAANGPTAPYSSRLTPIAKEIVARDQPNSASNGTISTPGAALTPAGERADGDRGLGVDRDAERVVSLVGLGVDLLQLLEDGVGLLDPFWGRHLATRMSRKPSRLSLVLIVCWVGNSSSV